MKTDRGQRSRRNRPTQVGPSRRGGRNQLRNMRTGSDDGRITWIIGRGIHDTAWIIPTALSAKAPYPGRTASPRRPKRQGTKIDPKPETQKSIATAKHANAVWSW